MPEVPFIQYIRPDGRRQPIMMDRPQGLYLKAMRLIEAGFSFTAEELPGGIVSLTCVDPEDEHDIAIVLCHDKKQLGMKVDELIEAAWDYAGQVRIRIKV